MIFFFCKEKTAYDMRISDCSSDVCSSDLYQIWLDRASIRLTPIKDVNIDVGRFANPFWTGDILFDNDMNFDGVAISGRAPVNERFALFGTAGAFPVFNTDLNFGSRNAPVQSASSGPYKSKDKYQIGRAHV